VRKRAIAIMLLSSDEDLEETLNLDNQVLETVRRIRDEVQSQYGHPLSYMIIRKRSEYVHDLLKGVVGSGKKKNKQKKQVQYQEIHSSSSLCLWFLSLSD
jgi:Fe2+ transport system protein B